MSLASLEGRTALITGAARRLGRAIALGLAREGVNVVLHYRGSDDVVEETRVQLAMLPVRHWTVRAELQKPEESETLIQRALDAAGTLDILVNNASIFQSNTLTNVDYSSLVQHMQVNAWVPFVLIRDFARLVGRGKVVNLLDSRISGYDWDHTAYILSKHLLAVLTQMTALKYAPDITVNAVAPGLILPPAGKDDKYLDKLATTVPLKRHGDAGDVTAAITYLLKSDYVTGQIINVDGGRHMVRCDA